MKALSDFLALILFFAVYGIVYWLGHPQTAIYYATAVAIAITVIQIVFARIKRRKLDLIQKINYSVIVIFGITGILLRSPLYLYWKPSVISWLTALVLAVSVLRHKNGLKLLLGSKMILPEFAWTRLSWMWVAFLTVIGVLNLIVAFNFEEKIWVAYKTFGTLSLTVVFVVIQGIYLNKHIIEEPDQDNKSEQSAPDT